MKIQKNENLKYYFYFINERMNIFWNKKNNLKYPFTKDEILNNNKFTNVYRVLDRVSQYLIKNIIYHQKNKNLKYSKKDIIFRIILFKIFNKIETWEFLENKFGDIKISTFNYEKFSKVLNERMNNTTIFSAAYIMTGSCTQYKSLGSSKHKKWLKLLEDYFINSNTSEKILNSKNFIDVYNILKEIPMIGNFLAYQYSIDLNYSNVINFSENDFVITGPGAIRGIRKTFKLPQKTKEKDFIEIIKYIQNNFDILIAKFGYKNTFKNLYGRNPTLIDLQNVFCETDKYLRVKKPTLVLNNSKTNSRIKQKYKEKESSKKEKISYFFPPKWNFKF